MEQTSVELAETLADVARALLGEDDFQATLVKITTLTVETTAATTQECRLFGKHFDDLGAGSNRALEFTPPHCLGRSASRSLEPGP